jgi:hypothetical protein
MDNPEKLATVGTQEEDKQNKIYNTICVGYHYAHKTQITYIRHGYEIHSRDKKNAIQKAKMMSNTDHNRKSGEHMCSRRISRNIVLSNV